MDQEKRGPKRPPPKAAARSVANSHTSPAVIDRVTMIATALDLRRRGNTYKQIGAAMGIHPSYAFKLVEQGIELTISRPAETVPVSHFLRMGQRDT